MDELYKLRQEIDEIDNELVRLFEKRMGISKKVAEYKRINKMPIYDETRETKIIKKNIDRLDDKSISHELETFYKMIFRISRDIQEREINNSKWNKIQWVFLLESRYKI